LVPQEDIVHQELTVAQALRFSARLRLPADTPDVEIQKLILQTMDQLGLRDSAGHFIECLSGGQRKRVSVAAELLGRPAVLFLDEPSSGLDPATESQLMEVLRELTNTGCTVVCTTHVMENAYLMDELIVITGGCVAFLGTAQEAREYFGVQRLHALYERLLERPAQEWKRDFAALQIPAESEPSAAPKVSAPPPRRALALPILLARQWAILASDWRNFAILAGQPVIIAALVAWATSDESLALFFAYVATLWFGCSNAAQAIVKEIPIYRRERLIGVSAHAYLTSKFLFLFAVTAMQGLLLYGCLVAGLGGTDGAPEFQITALLGIALAAVGIGSAMSALARSEMQAVLLVPLVLIPQILFSGHPVSVSEMKPAVYSVSRTMPTFAAQTLMDASFLWQRKTVRETVEAHWQSVRNIQRQVQFQTGDTFTRLGPAAISLATHAFWAALTYYVAWRGLRRRERMRR
jgi:energy-coupling factor transporter ATP-binding protein EcfA2